MHAIVTGGAGFIGRWVVAKLLQEGHEVAAIDDLSSGSEENIEEFHDNQSFSFIKGDIRDPSALNKIFPQSHGTPQACFHLAAKINVQQSLDSPRETFQNDVDGTFEVLERCRLNRIKFVFVSSCMVYAPSKGESITETHPTLAASPYAACKLAGEELTLSYYRSFGLPTVVLRPFNTYGPFQRADGEGGVMSIFLNRALHRQTLDIYGTGAQTRDFLYVEDCASFIVAAGLHEKANGTIINAGSGRDIAINDLAKMIAAGRCDIRHVPHIHPQSEIAKLVCDISNAQTTLGWMPKVDLLDGIEKTRQWLNSKMEV